MFARLVGESFVRNPRRKILTAAALVVAMAVATATLTVALEVGDRLGREFRSLGANLLITPESDTLPLEIGGVDYRPVDEGAYLPEADLGKLKMIFWRNNILGFTPFLDVPVSIRASREAASKPPSVTHPWWRIEGQWFGDDREECVVGATLAATYPGGLAVGDVIYVTADNADRAREQARPLLVRGIVSTGG